MVLLAATLVACATLLLFVQTAPGMRVAAKWIAHELDDALPASVSIGAMEHFGWFAPTVRELTFFDPHGTLVLRATRAEIAFDVSDLLRGVVTVPWARVEGGDIVIAVQADGRTGLETAFSDSSGESNRDGALVRFSRLEVKDFHVVLMPAKDQKIVIHDVTGLVRVTRPPRAGVRIELEGIRGGVLRPELAAEKVHLSRVDGWVHGAAPQVMELAFWTKLGHGSARVDGRISFFDRNKTPLVIHLRPHGGAKAYLAAALVFLRASGAEDVEVKIDDES